jgi:hypothetical protein
VIVAFVLQLWSYYRYYASVQHVEWAKYTSYFLENCGNRDPLAKGTVYKHSTYTGNVNGNFRCRKPIPLCAYAVVAS